MKEEGLAGGFGGKKERVHEEEMSWRTRKKKRRWEVGRWDEGETKEKTWKRNREEGRRSFGVGGRSLELENLGCHLGRAEGDLSVREQRVGRVGGRLDVGAQRRRSAGRLDGEMVVSRRDDGEVVWATIHVVLG